MRLGEQINCDF